MAASVCCRLTTWPYIVNDPTASSLTISSSPEDSAASSAESEDKSASGPTSPALGVVAVGQTWTQLNQGTLVANSAALSIGGPVLSTAGRTVSTSDAGLVAGTWTIAIPGTVAAHADILTAAGQMYARLGSKNGQLLVSGETLEQGGPITTIAKKCHSTRIFGASNQYIHHPPL